MPYEVTRWLGVDSVNPLLDVDGEKIQAAELNDVSRFTFEQIADAIERTYLNE
jgi:hypothetical protein